MVKRGTGAAIPDEHPHFSLILLKPLLQFAHIDPVLIEKAQSLLASDIRISRFSPVVIAKFTHEVFNPITCICRQSVTHMALKCPLQTLLIYRLREVRYTVMIAEPNRLPVIYSQNNAKAVP